MAVESNYVILIAMLSDWLKDLALSLTDEKQTQNPPCLTWAVFSGL